MIVAATAENRWNWILQRFCAFEDNKPQNQFKMRSVQNIWILRMVKLLSVKLINVSKIAILFFVTVRQSWSKRNCPSARSILL
jgi:hypothetical protein